MLSHDCCCGGGGQNFLKVLLLALAIEVADGGGEGRLVLAATTEKEEVVLEEDEDPYPPTPKYMAVQGKPKRRSDEGKQASRRLWQIVKADLIVLSSFLCRKHVRNLGIVVLCFTAPFSGRIFFEDDFSRSSCSSNYSGRKNETTYSTTTTTTIWMKTNAAARPDLALAGFSLAKSAIDRITGYTISSVTLLKTLVAPIYEVVESFSSGNSIPMVILHMICFVYSPEKSNIFHNRPLIERLLKLFARELWQVHSRCHSDRP
jgi:hypothetical protein